MSLSETQEQYLCRCVRLIDVPAIWSGRFVAWLVLPMIGALVYEVVLRYGFNRPTLWAYDITYMLYGTLFMLGAAYTMVYDKHVRADFLFNILSPRLQGTLDFLFTVVLFFPAVFIFTVVTTDYAWTSWVRGERAMTSPWMPPLYPLKAIMPITGALLLTQGLSLALKGLYSMLTNKQFPGGRV